MKKITLFMLIVFMTITLQGQNKLLSSIDEYYDGFFWFTTVANNYEYDSNNNLIVETNYNYDFLSSSWKTSSKTTYVYNLSNKVTTSIEQNWNAITNKLENSYRSSSTYTSGNYAGESGENWDGTKWVYEWKNLVTYNSNSLPESAVLYNWDGSQWVLDGRESISYNVNNKITIDITENWVSSQWVNANKTMLSYDANNKISLYRSAEWDDFNLIWNVTDKIDYVLDANGNRTSETGTEINTNIKNKREYTYNASSLMSSFANPFKDKTGVDYIFEDFPYFNKLLGYSYFDYDTATSSYKNTRRTTYDYTNSFTLGKEKFETENATISVFPNPTKDVLTIQNSSNNAIDKVIVTDISGKTILEQNQNTNQVSVQNLAIGMYFIQAFSGERKYQAKFIKE